MICFTRLSHKSNFLSEKNQTGLHSGPIIIQSLYKFPGDLSKHSWFPPPSKLAPRLITVLFYVDDAVFLSQTSVVLKCALKLFATLCTNDELTINYEKRKMLVFTKCPGIHTWQLSEYKIKQTKVFRYLGIVFQASGQRNTYLDYITQNAQRAVLATSLFFQNKRWVIF